MNERRVRSTRAASRVSRRKFLTLTAAAALAAPAATLARAAAVPAKAALRPKGAATPPAAAAPGRRVASAKEIEKLKGYLESSLKAVRAYELPPGSDMAFSFRAMKPRRTRRGG